MIKYLIGAIRLVPVKSFMAAGLAACLSLSGSAEAGVVDLSTGVQTHVESGRDVDNIWTVASTNVTLSTNKLETLLPGFPANVWAPDTAASKWLVPVAFGQQTAPTGDYAYSTNFNVTAADVVAGAVLSGRYLSDNSTTDIILQRGADTPIHLTPLNGVGSGTYKTWTTLNGVGLQEGAYSLTFLVHNDRAETGNPTGFRFEGGYTGAVPEPASLVMGALSTLALGGLSWKRRAGRQG
jgi:hypothetical protein